MENVRSITAKLLLADVSCAEALLPSITSHVYENAQINVAMQRCAKERSMSSQTAEGNGR